MDTFGGNTGSPVPTNTGPAQTNQSTGGNAVIPTLPSSLNSTSLAPSTPITVPQAPQPTNPQVTNASVPNPIPSAASIINQETQQTPMEKQQSDLLSQIAQLTGGQQSLATQQATQENAAGVGGNGALTKSVNDLTVQLNGLNDQATLLQNNASQGGAIQSQDALNAIGKQSTYGQSTATNADLYRNSIQQATIASQSLTVKSALFAAQGNYTMAKNAADQAAQVAFDAQTQQIDGLKAGLAAIQPQLTKEEKAQSDLVQAQLQDRQNQITQAKEDYKTGQAMAIAAMQSNPNDPNAQYAGQQALQISPQDPQYLQKVTALVGNYQTLDTKLKLAQLNNTNLDTKIKQQQLGGSAPDVSQYTPQQQAQLKSSGFLNYNSETQGLAQQLVSGNLAPADLSKRATGNSPYNKVLAAADAYSMATTGQHFNIAQAQRDYKFATNVQTQNTLNYLTSLVGTDNGSGTPSGGNLDQLISLSNARLTPNQNLSITGREAAGQGLPALNNVTQWAKLQTGNPQMAAYYATLTEVSDQIAKILQGGGSGSGTSDAKLAQASALFQKGFTPDQVSAVASTLKGLLTNRAKGIIGNNAYLSDYAQNLGITQNSQISTQPTIIPAAQIPSGYYQASDGLLYQK